MGGSAYLLCFPQQMKVRALSLDLGRVHIWLVFLTTIGSLETACSARLSDSELLGLDAQCSHLGERSRLGPEARIYGCLLGL